MPKGWLNFSEVVFNFQWVHICASEKASMLLMNPDYILQGQNVMKIISAKIMY